MGFLKNLFGGKKQAEPEYTGPPPVCGHATLVPRWDSAEDMGKTGKVSVYRCESCLEDFSPADAEQIRINAETKAPLPPT